MKASAILRAILISPETVTLVFPLLGPIYFPRFLDLFRVKLESDLMFSLTAAGLALGMLGACYTLGADILAPTGAKKVLLDWPDYSSLKTRIYVGCSWCVYGAISSFLALYMVSERQYALWGIALLAGGILSAATSTALVAMAKISVREIFRE